MPIPAPRIPLIAATTLIALSGSAIAANQIIDDTLPVEWVTISIHMPDGRVIETVEQRYPSRSRVHLKTGVIPAFKPATQAPSSSGSAESIVTELSEEESQAIDAQIESEIDDASAQPVEPSVVDQPIEET